MNKHGRFQALLPAIAVMLLIFIHSAMDADTSLMESNWFTALIEKMFPGVFTPETLTFFVRKTGHFLEYLMLGLALRWGMRRFIDENQDAKAVLITWAIGAAYAVTDEIHQMFVPGRSCEARDMCIDAAGVIAGALIMDAVIRSKRRREKGDNETGPLSP